MYVRSNLRGRRRNVLKKTKYMPVAIPQELVEIIDSVVKSGKYGYRSRNEFVVEAIRRRLEELGVFGGDAQL